MFRAQAFCSLRPVPMLKIPSASALEHQVPLRLRCGNLVYLPPLLSKHQGFSEAGFGQPILTPGPLTHSTSLLTPRNRKDCLWLLRKPWLTGRRNIRLSSQGGAPNGLYSFLVKSTKANDINELVKELSCYIVFSVSSSTLSQVCPDRVKGQWELEEGTKVAFLGTVGWGGGHLWRPLEVE